MPGQSLTITQQQQLKLSPQQIQVMKLLTQSTLEFNERVEQEIEENPALEKNENENESVNDNVNSNDDDNDFDYDDENEGSDNYGDKDEDNGLDYDDGNNDDFTLGDYVSSDDIPSYQYNDMTEQERRPEMSYHL